jgi:hypothetical protein
LTRLGHSAFETISGHVVDVVLLQLTINDPSRVGWWIDAIEKPNPAEKAMEIKLQELKQFDQEEQISHPEYRIVFGKLEGGTLLSKYADSIHGQGSFDDPSYVRNFWEMAFLLDGWIFQQTSSQTDEPNCGCSNIFCWENGNGRLAEMMKAKAEQGYSSGKWKAGQSAWGRTGVAISGMGRLYVNQYQGGSFDTNVAVIYPLREKDISAIWVYCRSDEFIANVRKIDRKPKVTGVSISWGKEKYPSTPRFGDLKITN